MMLSHRFLDELNNRIMIGDGAIGTELFARGHAPMGGVERLNLLSPDSVLELHRDYVSAGSHVIETNTFSANRPNLAKYGRESEVRDIIIAGVNLARSAAGKDIYVAGSIGPLPMVNGESLSFSDKVSCFTEQITSLLEGGVDLLIFESFTDLKELKLALEAAKSLIDLPIIAQMAFGIDGLTSSGNTADEIAIQFRTSGVDVIGANCGYGAISIIKAIRKMSQYDFPMSAYINAGFPEEVEGRLIYLSTPDYIVSRAKELVKLGVHLVGGCCGTGPETIQAISKALKTETPASRTILVKEVPHKDKSITSEPVTEHPPTKRIFVELDPPTDPEITSLIESAKEVKKVGATDLTVADNPLASARVEAITVASLLQKKSGLPATVHLTGRDRNRIALKSTIMAAHVLGIRSLLCITGDPVRMCQEPNTSGVFDVTSVGLVQMVAGFNSGHRTHENSKTAFSIGVGLNPNVRSFSGQINKLQRKIEAGAQFALTQPIYDEERLDLIQQALSDANIDIPVYIGILPITSARNAEFLHNEVPGIFVPDDIRKQLARYNDVTDQRAVAVELTASFAGRIIQRVSGLYIITPRNNISLVTPIISRL